jgi:hypothetical protein
VVATGALLLLLLQSMLRLLLLLLPPLTTRFRNSVRSRNHTVASCFSALMCWLMERKERLWGWGTTPCC